jgi:acid phosphatase (class A)
MMTVAAGLAGAGPVLAQAPVSAPPAVASASAPPSPAGALPRMQGYLGKARIPNAIAILPPPPVKGSTMDLLDSETYTKTRALAGSDRWALAARDAVQYVQEFECPLGLKMADWPKSVIILLARVARDSSDITNQAKDHFNHPRPFIAPNGAICTEDMRAGLMKSFSYPSGHATYSWTMALILAEMAPDRATEILARSRAFGESRVVCGVHTVSDIEEGRTTGASLVAVLHSDAAFRADLAAASADLKAALATAHAAPDAGQCKVETEAEAHTPWINPTAGK